MNYKNYEKANIAFANNDYKKALAYYLTVNFDSKNTEYEILKLRLAESYAKLNLNEDAIRVLKDLLAYYLANTNLNKSIAICKKILKIDPDDVEVIQTMGMLLSRIGQIKESIKYYKALALNYEYVGSIEKAIESINILQKLGQHDADKVLDKLIARYKKNVEKQLLSKINGIIKELRKAGETDLLSVALSFKLSASQDIDDDTLIELINLYFYSGNIERALILSLLGIDKNKKEKTYYRFLLKALLAVGDKDSALQLVKDRMIKLDKKNMKNLELLLQNISRMGARLPDEIFNDEKTVIVSAPRDEYAREFNDSKILAAEGLYDDALNILSTLLVKYPNDDVVRKYFKEVSELSMRNTKVKFKNTTVEEAYKELESVIQGLDKTIAESEGENRSVFINKILNLALDSFTLYHIGIALMIMEQWHFAEQIFEYAVKKGQKDELLIKEAQILSYYAGGLSNLEDTKYVKKLRRLVERYTEEELKLTALYYLGQIYEEYSDSANAIKTYREILSIKENYRDVEIRLSSIVR